MSTKVRRCVICKSLNAKPGKVCLTCVHSIFTLRCLCERGCCA